MRALRRTFSARRFLSSRFSRFVSSSIDPDSSATRASRSAISFSWCATFCCISSNAGPLTPSLIFSWMRWICTCIRIICWSSIFCSSVNSCASSLKPLSSCRCWSRNRRSSSSVWCAISTIDRRAFRCISSALSSSCFDWIWRFTTARALRTSAMRRPVSLCCSSAVSFKRSLRRSSFCFMAMRSSAGMFCTLASASLASRPLARLFMRRC
mmetsp:Transcript_47677/g.147082  ORF Transcript_47677/g.147082 Transcript_47677/m.147082 type:complete len:211 (-) Transcript_47677:40-672(-)